MITPLQLTVLIQSLITTEPHPLIHNPEWRQQTMELINNKLIVPDNTILQTFTLTPRGEKFMQMILETPLPEQVWIDPRIQSKKSVDCAPPSTLSIPEWSDKVTFFKRKIMD